MWMHRRAKGSGGRGREVEHERVCEAERKPECLEEGQKESEHVSMSRVGGKAWAGLLLLQAGRECQARGGLVEGRGRPGQS